LPAFEHGPAIGTVSLVLGVGSSQKTLTKLVDDLFNGVSRSSAITTADCARTSLLHGGAAANRLGTWVTLAA